MGGAAARSSGARKVGAVSGEVLAGAEGGLFAGGYWVWWAAGQRTCTREECEGGSHEGGGEDEGRMHTPVCKRAAASASSSNYGLTTKWMEMTGAVVC